MRLKEWRYLLGGLSPQLPTSQYVLVQPSLPLVNFSWCRSDIKIVTYLLGKL